MENILQAYEAGLQAEAEPGLAMAAQQGQHRVYLHSDTWSPALPSAPAA